MKALQRMDKVSKLELEHAARYAEETTKVFMFNWSKAMFPDVFEHAKIETRPATSDDYYIPPSLANKCIVVTRTSFDETACLLLSCFPFKKDLEKCEKSDPVQWVPLAKSHILACQPACFGAEPSVDTEWRDEKCVQANPLKKFFAMLPEKHLGQEFKQPLHNGIDLVKGQLLLNHDYCEAYGLKFRNGDCETFTGQSVLEIIFGKTVVRKIVQHNLNPPKPGTPPPIPDVFQRFQRRKRSTDDFTISNVDFDEPDSNASTLAAEIAKELSIDFGIDVSLAMLERLLVKRAPKLMMQAVANLPIKSVLIQSVVRSYTSLAITSVQVMGKMVSGASTLLAGYGIATMILDIIDPYNYDKAMNAKMLARINQKLDLEYYGRETDFDMELTPEFLWDHVYASTNESFRLEHMVDKISEYIQELRSEPPKVELPPLEWKQQSGEWKNSWERLLHAIIIFALVACSMLAWQWIHIWAALVFFTLVWWNSSNE